MSDEREKKARVSTTVPEELMMRIRHDLVDRRLSFSQWLEGQMRIYLDMQGRAERKSEEQR